MGEFNEQRGYLHKIGTQGIQQQNYGARLSIQAQYTYLLLLRWLLRHNHQATGTLIVIIVVAAKC